MSVPDANSLDLTTGMTLEAWVSPSGGSDYRTLVVKERTGNIDYGLYSNSDTNRPESQVRVGGTSRLLAGTASLPTGTWTHLAATYDGTTQRLYVNGGQVAQLTVLGIDLHLRLAAQDRRQRDLGRVLQRAHRRGPRLQPRAQRRRDQRGHEHGDLEPRQHPTERTRDPRRDGRPLAGRA